MTSRNRLRVEDTHADDMEVYEQLSKLQGMYEQVNKLRTLLPEGLLQPTRTSDHRSPEKLAAGLRDAATNGSAQIKTFKRAYHSDDMRGLWQTVNASEFPQSQYHGYDNWLIDYTSSLQDMKRAKGIVNGDAEKAETKGEAIDPDTVVESFKTAYPDITVTETSRADSIFLELEFGDVKFSIKGPKSTSDEIPSYEIASSSGKKPKATEERIVAYIAQNHKNASLTTLLSLLASYEGPEAFTCHKCQGIFDDDLALPLLRKKIESKESWSEISWRPLHSSCV